MSFKFKISGRAAISFMFGIICAVITIWLLGAMFCRNYTPFVYFKDLKRNGYKPGIKIHMTREGFATTAVGSDGAIAPDVSWDNPSGFVLMLGNSYAEGAHVKDADKLHRIANAALRKNGNVPQIINVAMSSQFIGDFVWQLEHYEKKYNNKIKAVIIVLAGNCYYPRFESDYGGKLQKNSLKQYCFAAPKPRRDSAYLFNRMKYNFDLNAFLVIGHLWQTSKLNFSPGPHKTEIKSCRTNVSDFNYINDCLRKIRSVTDVPILLLWAEEIPAISKGQIIYAKKTETGNVVSAMAKTNSLDFISMTDTYNEFVKKNKKMVTGPLNIPPGTGHWNRDGHRITAEKIVEYLNGVFDEGDKK